MKKSFVLFAFLSILSIGVWSASATTITVDGYPENAWNNSDVARSPDKTTDAPCSMADENANIIDNYITDNGQKLFIRFDVAGEILGGPSTNIFYEYYIYIDADNNPATGSTDPWYSPIGSDYYIYLSGGNHNFQDKKLYSWNGSSWVLSAATVTAVAGCHNCAEDNTMELSVNLSDIGNPTCKMAFAFGAISGDCWGGDFNNEPSAAGILYTISTCPGKSIDGMIDDWDGNELSDMDGCEECIPATVNIRQNGIAWDDNNIYIRMTMEDTAFWGQGYKEYRIWLDIDPNTQVGYQPYLNTTPACQSNPEWCIAWPDFYADYHITIATDAGGAIEETIGQKLFLDCSQVDCSATSSLIPANGDKFEAATGWKYVEIAIPRANIPEFNPECFEFAFTTYDANSLNICDPPGDNNNDWGGQGIGITTNCPSTLITLSSFRAEASNKKVVLTWTTESEINNAGFNIYRSETEQGDFVKINKALIPAQGSATQGATYSFIDENVKNKTTYYYRLEDVELNGTTTTHFTVSATPRLMWFLK